MKNTFWCIKLLTNTHDVKICLSNTGVISQTEVARRAGLSDHFEVGPDDAVKISNVPKVLNGALLSCFVKTPSCQDVAHTTFVVKGTSVIQLCDHVFLVVINENEMFCVSEN